MHPKYEVEINGKVVSFRFLDEVLNYIEDSIDLNLSNEELWTRLRELELGSTVSIDGIVSVTLK